MTSIPITGLSNAAGAKFENIGDKYVGRVTAAKEQQDTDINGGPKFYPNSGDPMMVMLITLQPADGEPVTLWARRGDANPAIAQGEGLPMLNAIGAAIVVAMPDKAPAIEIGAELAVAFTGMAKPAKSGYSGAKLYRAEYRPPKAETSLPADLFSS